jgi:hypothetical protein
MRLQPRRAFGLALVGCACVIVAAPRPSSGQIGVQATIVARTTVSSAMPTSIRGAASRGDNAPIPHAKLRLRDVSSGKIRAMTIANDMGQFVFSNVESGAYIVELISETGKILTIGQTVNVRAGETVATFVRLGAKVPWFSGFFGNAATSVALAAASTGLTAVAPEAMRPASPQK